MEGDNPGRLLLGYLLAAVVMDRQPETGMMAGMSPPHLAPAAVTEALAYAEDWLAFRQRYLRQPGVQAAVWYDGALALSTAYGLADVETGTRLTRRHLFRIASHSKPVTATLVLQLVDRGALRPDDRCRERLADCPAALGDVTVRELLQHTSGLVRDGRDGDFWQLGGPFPDAAGLDDVLADPDAAVLERNERFKYSNIGYALLGRILEQASGHTYAELVAQRICAPLGLADTGAEYDPDRAADYATGYSALSYADVRVPIEHVDTGALAAATGCWSTAEDLVRFFAAHLPGDERLLPEGSKREMRHGGWETDTPDKRYGLGLSVATVGERTLVGHGGGYPGHATASAFDPDGGLVLSVLTNAIDGAPEGLLHGVVKLVDRACDGAVAPLAGAERFTGRFASLWGVLDVALLGGRLWLLNPAVADPGEPAPELEIVDNVTLRLGGGSGYGAPGEPMSYTFAADGTVASLRGPSGATLVPLERLTLPDRVTLGWRP